MSPTAPATPAPATTSAQALQNLQSYQGQMQSPDQAIQGADASLGVNQAQQQVQGLQSAITNTTNLLNQVAPTVYGNTGGYNVTAGQVEGQISDQSAPIQQNLTSQESNYNTANANYTNLESQAEDQANADLASQNNQLSTLQGIYQDLYGQEQAAQQAQIQQQEFNQSQQTQEQEFAQQMAASNQQFQEEMGASGGTNSLIDSLLGGGSTTPSTSSPTGSEFMALKDPSNPAEGFAFKDSAGQSANALQYAQAQNIPLRTLLTQMANAGDTGAKTALTFIGNDGNADPTKITTQALANLYTALTGRGIAVYNPSSSQGFSYSGLSGEGAKL